MPTDQSKDVAAFNESYKRLIESEKKPVDWRMEYMRLWCWVDGIIDLAPKIRQQLIEDQRLLLKFEHHLTLRPPDMPGPG